MEVVISKGGFVLYTAHHLTHMITFGVSVLIGLFKKRCHTNGFSDFRAADLLFLLPIPAYFSFSTVTQKDLENIMDIGGATWLVTL